MSPSKKQKFVAEVIEVNKTLDHPQTNYSQSLELIITTLVLYIEHKWLYVSIDIFQQKKVETWHSITTPEP